MPFIADRNMRKACVGALSDLGEKVYFSELCDWVYPPVNTHPDIQIHFVNNKTAFVPPELYGYYRGILPDYIDLRVGNKRLGGTYPGDIAYNIARIGRNIILNIKYADDEIVKYYKSIGCNFINVNQGYAKCNICTDGNVAVTEDEGIYKALLKGGINTLKLPCGEVFLSGFSNGFIGGASGCFKKNILFCGKMRNEELFEYIKCFFEENGSGVKVLDDGDLTDYGSILYFE